VEDPSGVRTGIRLCTYNSDPVFSPSWYALFLTGGNTTFEVYDNTFVVPFHGNNSAGLNKAGGIPSGDEFPLSVRIDLLTSTVSTYNITFAYIGSPEVNATICGNAIPSDFTFTVQAISSGSVVASGSFTSKKAIFPGGTSADWQQGWISWTRTSSSQPSKTTLAFTSTTNGGCGPLIDYVFINSFTTVPTTGSTGSTGSTGTTLFSTSTTGTTGSTASSGTTGSTGTTATSGTTGSTGSTGTTGTTGTTGIPAKVFVIDMDNCTDADNIKIAIHFGFEGGDDSSWIGLYHHDGNVTAADTAHVSWQWTCEKTLTGCVTTVVNGEGMLWVASNIPDGTYELRIYRQGYKEKAGVSAPFLISRQCPAATTGTTLVHFSTGTTGSTGSTGTSASTGSTGSTASSGTTKK